VGNENIHQNPGSGPRSGRINPANPARPQSEVIVEGHLGDRCSVMNACLHVAFVEASMKIITKKDEEFAFQLFVGSDILQANAKPTPL
jgi:hypothetical protein